jgi:NAD+ diphosphatase
MEQARWQPSLFEDDHPGGWAIVRAGQEFLLDANGVLFPRQWIKQQALGPYSEHGLGRLEGEPVHLLLLERPVELPGAAWQGLRPLMLESDAQTFRMLSYASQIATWAEDHRFCGRCGQTMEPVKGERAMHCPRCGLRQYPRISPSMIVLVTRGEQILLARSPRFVKNMYSTLAGFVEPGETVEECVEREVQEEVGLRVKNIRYLASQSWPFPHSLMLGFHAEYAGGDIVPQEGEIEDAQWFSIRALPPLPAPKSIARYLIERYVARCLGRDEPVAPG